MYNGKLLSNLLAARLMGKPKIEAPTPQIFRSRKIFTFLLFTQKSVDGI